MMSIYICFTIAVGFAARLMELYAQQLICKHTASRWGRGLSSSGRAAHPGRLPVQCGSRGVAAAGRTPRRAAVQRAAADMAGRRRCGL